MSQAQVCQQKRPQFLAAWMSSPLKIGALTPSSKSLARAMASHVCPETEGMVVELGGGTGAVTHALLEAKIPYERLLVIERDPRLYTILHAKFPQLRIVRADVVELAQVMDECGVKKISALVSSLPLLSMPRGIRSQIESRMCATLAHGGRLIQFTYGAVSPIPHGRWRSLRIFGKREQLVMSNVPPAWIWVYKRDRRIKCRTK